MITQGPGSTIRVGPPSSTPPPSGGVLYDAFGEGINLAQFAPTVAKTERRILDELVDVANRLLFVRQLSSLRQYPSDNELQSLHLYLLCTCIDVLARPSWLTFDNWLSLKRPEDERLFRDRTAHQAVARIQTELDLPELLSACRSLYRGYSKRHGMARRFIDFFNVLPPSATGLLLRSYRLVPNGSPSTAEVRFAEWQKLADPERISRIADYFFQYRRNDFTHRAQSHRTTPEAQVVPSPQAPTQTPHVLYFNSRRRGSPRLAVFVDGNEREILETVIICHCRALLGLDHGEEFISRHVSRLDQYHLLARLHHDLTYNWWALKYYSISWMPSEDEDDIYYGLPEFTCESLEAADTIEAPRFNVPKDALARDAQQLASHLRGLNRHIAPYNETYPPLYIRNQQDEPRPLPDDRTAKTAAREVLFSALRNTYDFSLALFLLPRLLAVAKGMLNVVPDQGGWLVYGYSRPNFRVLV